MNKKKSKEKEDAQRKSKNSRRPRLKNITMTVTTFSALLASLLKKRQQIANSDEINK